MKKVEILIATLATVGLVMAMAGCGNDSNDNQDTSTVNNYAPTNAPVEVSQEMSAMGLSSIVYFLFLPVRRS